MDVKNKCRFLLSHARLWPRGRSLVGRIGFSAALFLAVASSSSSAPVAPSAHWSRLIGQSTTYPGFADYKGAYSHVNKVPWSTLDWSSDGCEQPRYPTQYRELFNAACQQLDFCWQNVRRLPGASSPDKRRCDVRFHRELIRTCGDVNAGSACNRWADEYFHRARKSSW